MKVIMKVSEIFDRDLWIEVCEMKGINSWACADGKIGPADTIEFNEEEAAKLGLLPSQDNDLYLQD